MSVDRIEIGDPDRPDYWEAAFVALKVINKDDLIHIP